MEPIERGVSFIPAYIINGMCRQRHAFFRLAGDSRGGRGGGGAEGTVTNIVSRSRRREPSFISLSCLDATIEATIRLP